MRIAVIVAAACLLGGGAPALAADQAPVKVAEPAKLDDSTWAELRSESAELQVLDERFQKLAAQAELTRQDFQRKRAVWQGKVNAAAERAGVLPSCLPAPATKTWVRADGTDGSCLKPPPAPKKSESEKK